MNQPAGKYQFEIYLDHVARERHDDVVAACKTIWADTGSVAWNYAAPEPDDADSESILTGYGWLMGRTPEQLADQLRVAVIGANGKQCAVTILHSELLSLGEVAVTYGPRGARQIHELRGDKYVRVG